MARVATGIRLEDVVDLFAGAGGFSEGARQAGCRILWAANHWPAAVAAHAANHPDTLHITQDLHQADWTLVPKHDLLLASPSCTGHSLARGKNKQRHDAARSTAWAVVSALEIHQPPVALVENVPQFLKWVLYPAWEHAVKALGYSLAPHIIDAADHGVPQNRERLFLVITKSKNPLYLTLPKVPHVPISTVLDWDSGSWSPIDSEARLRANRKPLVDATLERIRIGRERYGERFLIAYYGEGSGVTGRSLDRPIGTLTTLDRYGLIDGDRMRMLTPAEVRAAMGFPDTYKLPSSNRRLAIHLLGNAVSPTVARDLINAIKASAWSTRAA